MNLKDRSDFTIFGGIILMLFGIYILIFYFQRLIGLIFLVLGACGIVIGQRLCEINKKKRGIV